MKYDSFAVVWYILRWCGGVECMPFTRGLIWTLSRRLVASWLWRKRGNGQRVREDRLFLQNIEIRRRKIRNCKQHS